MNNAVNLEIRDAVDPGKLARGNKTTAAPGGLEWNGDLDNEYIFGTSWADILKGGSGNDLLYGFEDGDEIEGGYGNDRLFGDAGDDLMFAFEKASLAMNTGDANDVNLLSGGSGNDRLYG